MHRSTWITLPRVRSGSVLLAVLLVLVPAAVRGRTAVDADTVTRRLRDAVYNHELDTGGYYGLRREILLEVEETITDPAEAARARALAHYYIGRWHQAIKTREMMVEYAEELRADRLLRLRRYYTEREEAMAAYLLARNECRQLLEIRPDAESHRLYGEILGQMLFLGDAGDAISIGGKARRNVSRALELNPNLVKAMIQEASRLAYTPLTFGGNPEEAREAFRLILRQGVSDPEDLFNIYGGFAMAAFAEGEDAESQSWFLEASAVYPGNIFASGMADYLGGSLK